MNMWVARAIEKERLEELPLCCRSAYKKYNGLKKPRCCGGTGCQVCWLIHRAKTGERIYN